MRRLKTYYYRSVTDDVVTSHQQNYRLPATYQWSTAPHLGLRRLVGWLSQVYCRWVRPVKLVMATSLPTTTGYVLYGNHTQPTGDVFLPIYLGGSQRFNAIVSPTNLGIPVIGHVIPHAGGLPVPTHLHQLRAFNLAVSQRLAAGQFVTIYPEAHVWPYYALIRPLPVSAFHFPVASQVPAYVMTRTYQPGHWRPHETVFVDGPFQPDDSLSKKSQQQKLQKQVTACMQRRAQASTVQAVTYQQRGEVD